MWHIHWNLRDAEDSLMRGWEDEVGWETETDRGKDDAKLKRGMWIEAAAAEVAGDGDEEKERRFGFEEACLPSLTFLSNLMKGEE